MRSNARALATSIVSLTLVVSSVGLATAQSTPTVQAAVSGSRQLKVYDLLGNELTTLSLNPGKETAFRLAVEDTDGDAVFYDTANDFQVDVSMNDLYPVTDDGQPVGDAARYEFDSGIASPIDSSNVELGFVDNPLAGLGVTADVIPTYTLAGTISCQDVNDTLGLGASNDLVGLTALALTDPICDLITDLLGTGDLLGDVTTADIDVAGTTVVGSVESGLELLHLAIGDLPVTLGSPSPGGPFADPNCDSGIGALDSSSCSTSGTNFTAMTGEPVGLQAEFIDHVVDVLGIPGTIVGGAVADIDAIKNALVASADATISELGYALDGYSDGDATTLVNSLLSISAVNLNDLTDISALDATWTVVPTLQVNPPATTEAGGFEGSLVATLIEPCTAC